jgi:hypothetical protein
LAASGQLPDPRRGQRAGYNRHVAQGGRGAPVSSAMAPQAPAGLLASTSTWRAYRNLIYFHEVDKGGHFAAWEEPELSSAELRAAFRSLRQSWPAALIRG